MAYFRWVSEIMVRRLVTDAVIGLYFIEHQNCYSWLLLKPELIPEVVYFHLDHQ